MSSRDVAEPSGTPASNAQAAPESPATDAAQPQPSAAGRTASAGAALRRSSSPGLVATGSDHSHHPPAVRVLSEGQVLASGGAQPSGSHLSVGEQPTPSVLSLGQHSVGEDVSVERRRAEEGEVPGTADAAGAPAPPPCCQCAVCVTRTGGEDSPVAGPSGAAAADPQLERLCRHTVEMMKLDGATEEQKQQLVKQLQVMVPSGAQSPPPPQEPFPFEGLPPELQLLVFSHLTARELCTSVLPVCRHWYQLGRDPVLWQHLSFDADNLVPTSTVVNILSFSTLLKSLRLEARRQVDKILFQVADTCKQLRSLTARFCDGLNSLLLEVLVKHCPLLERVNFEGSRFDDADCTAALTGLEHLRALNVSHCLRLEDAELVQMARRCRHLEELNVDGIGYLTDAAIQELVDQAGDRLLSLVLDGENLTDAGFRALGRCRNLQELCISFADGMTDASLPALGSLHDLMRLKIRRGNQLSAAALGRLFDGQNMPHLLHLDLSECSNLDDSTVEALTANCPLLTFLALSWCWDVTDAGLERIVTRLRFMRVMDLIGLVRITGQCFRLIPERLPELRYLNLEQCSDVQDVVVERVVRQRPQLQALDYYGDRVVPRPVEMESWADEVGEHARDIHLPITINFLLLREDGAA
ncbi:F-box/LRR-repeat protein 2-like [Amphibalanus amphitrite]|uniref:F-box/LRR-repeat protein 2-like n=1 Tax=Amphibalanus amphitrite TaxID=1232801 RepID=UPI001C927824|nr:F-box/LRR-repeat protein 2-like [Amphibalanus amphitrite]